MQDALPASIPPGDQDFLYALLDRAIDRLEDGRPIDLDELLGPRTDLREAALRMIRLAGRVATGPANELPSVRGYALVSELGRGGMGVVYLAHQERLGGRPVALKVLPAAAGLSPRAKERFISEALAIAKLRHPNVVAIYDVVHDRDTLAFAMELVDGPSLGQLIDERRELGAEGPRDQGELLVRESILEPSAAGFPSRDARAPDRNPAKIGTEKGFSVQQRSLAPSAPRSLDPPDVCRIGISIARALQAVHDAGLLHRDVKPSNILLRADGTPLLSDFGLVRQTDSTLTQTRHFAGTVAYAPPEQLRGEGEAVDARSDIYALGVTLYHALSLSVPFEARDPAQMLRRIEAGAASPLRKLNPRIPRDLETIVATAMDPDPRRRYATAAALSDDIERLLAFQPIRARRAGVLARAAKMVRRNRAAALGLFIGSLATLAIGVAAVTYVFFVPGWVAGHVREARLALLDPQYANAIYNAVFSNLASGPGIDAPRLAPAAFEAALRHYDAALRWSPFDEEIRRERKVVDEAAHDLKPLVRSRRAGILEPSPGGVPSPDAPAPDRNPATNGTERGFSVQPSVPPDPRSTGLFAYLTADIDSALTRWSQYAAARDPLAEPDPLVEAALGVAYLFREEPARAYPRLREACQAFPNVGFLTVYLADAALQCGDLDEAERLLDRAKPMARLDPNGGLERVSADLSAARGRDEEAEQRYRAHRFFPIFPGLIVFKYARFLESRGRLEEAVQQYARVARSDAQGRKPAAAFVAAMDRWWAGLSAVERLRRIRAALDEPPYAPESFVSLLRSYVECRDVLVRESFLAPSPGGIPSPDSRVQDGNPGKGGTEIGISVQQRPGGTVENSPAFQGWVPDGREYWSPVGTTEVRLTVPTALNPLGGPQPSDESLGYSHSVPRARLFPSPPSLGRSVAEFTRRGGSLPLSIFRLFDFGPTFFRAVRSPSLQSLSLSELAERMEIDTMTLWNRVPSFSCSLKNLQFAAWRWPVLQSMAVVSQNALRVAILAYVAALAPSSANGQCTTAPCFQGLGDLPGGSFYSFASKISSDGTTVGGSSATAQSPAGYWEAFRWRADTGMVYLGDLPGHDNIGIVGGLTADGNVVVGDSSSANGTLSAWLYREAFRWTQAEGMVGLGDDPRGDFLSVIRGISDDGSVAAGTVTVGTYPDPTFRRGATWTSGTWTIRTPDGTDSTFGGLSRNGQWACGYTGVPGHSHLLRWSESTGPQNLGTPPGRDDVGGYRPTEDGRTIVGYSSLPSPIRGFIWSESTGFGVLDDLPGGDTSSVSYSLSAYGGIIVGYGTSSIGQEAVVWDESLSIHRLADVFATAGVGVPAGWTLTAANDVIVNGNLVVLCGEGANPQGDTEAWIAHYMRGTPSVTIAGARSRRNCDLPIASFNGAVPKSSDGRQGGITELRIAFDTEPGGPGLNPVTIEQATCPAPTYVPYSGASAVGAGIDGNELVLTFTPGLENARTYRINIGPEVTSLPGQFVEVRVLAGDASGDGLVNAADRSAVVGVWTGSGFSCATDINSSGQTNAADRSAVVGAWTNPAGNCAP